MTPNAEPDTSATTTPLRRPPIRQAILVRSDAAHTFQTFVRTIGLWWPLQPFSSGHDRVRAVTFEQRLGGRVYETWDDGTTVEWGEVVEWDPPRRFTMTWNMTPAVTEVERGKPAKLGGSREDIFTTREAAEEFVKDDPLVLNGVVRDWYIREWDEMLVR